MFDLSVIVPMYNEEENVKPLYDSIVSALASLSLSYEILFVDDGSTDDTFLRAQAIAQNDGRLRIIKFKKNYGQTPAMVAGIENARGDVLITMDGDLQNDPADIPRLLCKVRAGYDLVVGWRHNRQDKLVTRKIPSRIANWLIGKVTGVPVKDNGCSLKAYRSEVIKGIPLYSEMHRFIPAMCSLAGASIVELKVNHRARQFGSSKYGLSRVFKVAMDIMAVKMLLFSPGRCLRAFAFVAVISAVIACVLTIAATFSMSSDGGSNGVVLYATAFLFGILSIVLIFWGILSELVFKTGNQKLERFAGLTKGQAMPGNSTLGIRRE